MTDQWMSSNKAYDIKIFLTGTQKRPIRDRSFTCLMDKFSEVIRLQGKDLRTENLSLKQPFSNCKTVLL